MGSPLAPADSGQWPNHVGSGGSFTCHLSIQPAVFTECSGFTVGSHKRDLHQSESTDRVLGECSLPPTYGGEVAGSTRASSPLTHSSLSVSADSESPPSDSTTQVSLTITGRSRHGVGATRMALMAEPRDHGQSVCSSEPTPPPRTGVQQPHLPGADLTWSRAPPVPCPSVL